MQDKALRFTFDITLVGTYEDVVNRVMEAMREYPVEEDELEQVVSDEELAEIKKLVHAGNYHGLDWSDVVTRIADKLCRPEHEIGPIVAHYMNELEA